MEWLELLPEREGWSDDLARVVSRGDYILWRYNNDHVILLSAAEGDTIAVLHGKGRVQARLAINRSTGEVVRPGPEIEIGEWEALVMGELDRYLADLERLRNNPWSALRISHARFSEGKPKEVEQ